MEHKSLRLCEEGSRAAREVGRGRLPERARSIVDAKVPHPVRGTFRTFCANYR